MEFLTRGLLIGLAIAMPVGPIGVLCIRRTLSDGLLSGLISGLGAATADALYGSIAAFGLTIISDPLLGHQSWLRLGGGLFLVSLGIKTFLANPSGQAGALDGRGFFPAYATTFFLTLTNPLTILSFMAIFAGLGLGQADSDRTAAAMMVLGVFIGSALWWMALSVGLSLFRHRLGQRAMRWINQVAGATILAFGLLALLGLL